MKKYLLPLFIFILLSTLANAELTTDIQSYYKFNTNNSVQTDELTLLNGTITDATFTLAGKIGGGYDIGTFAQNYRMTTSSADSFDNNFITYSIWYKPSATSGVGTIIGSGNQPDSPGIQYNPSGNSIEVLDGNGASSSVSLTALNTTQYHHIVYIRNGSATPGRFYVNNVDLGGLSSNVSFDNVSRPIWVGARTAVAQPVGGLVDEVGVWKRALSPSEISELYNNGTGLSYPFLPLNFSINITSQYSGEIINNVTATINGTQYHTTNGSIYTSILPESPDLYNITINSTGWFNQNFVNQNISEALQVKLNQTNITLRFVFDSGDLMNFSDINFTDIDNNVEFNVSSGILSFSPEAQVLNFTVSSFDNILTLINYSNNFSALEVSTYNVTVQATDNVLTFLNEDNGSVITGANITVTYPSGSSQVLTTNNSGSVNFSYVYGGVLELGNYNFLINKNDFVNMSFDQIINSSNIPFIQSYNVSTAKVFINIYDRTTNALITQNVSVDFVGVFNDTTNNGQVNKTDLGVVSSTYTVIAASNEYKTEQRTFEFTNQEIVNIDFYLLNTSNSNYGLLSVKTTDSYFRLVSDANVELLEYKPSSLSYVTVSECTTNVNGECSFGIELNTKTYYMRSVATIGGEVLIAETNQAGEIFTVSGETRNIVFTTRSEFNISDASKLVYSITETFASNISSISVSFSTTDGSSQKVCVEYYLKSLFTYTSVTGELYCLTASGAVQNLNSNVLLNRSNSYEARVYVNQSTYQDLLKTYVYPNDTSAETVLGNDLMSAFIMIFWLITLGFALHAKNMTLWFVIAIILSWAEVLIFPTFSIVSVSVFKTVISIMTIFVARKRRDLE